LAATPCISVAPAIGLAALLIAATPAAGLAASCTHEGVELQVLGSGGPELEDQRASSSYAAALAL
jgi:hypothetical protein